MDIGRTLAWQAKFELGYYRNCKFMGILLGFLRIRWNLGKRQLTPEYMSNRTSDFSNCLDLCTCVLVDIRPTVAIFAREAREQ